MPPRRPFESEEERELRREIAGGFKCRIGGHELVKRPAPSREAEIDKLLKEIERQTAVIGSLTKELDICEAALANSGQAVKTCYADRASISADLGRMREALEFYASASNWDEVHTMGMDRGDKARAACSPATGASGE